MIIQILEALRDLILGILPKSFCSAIFNRGAEYAFLCHPLDVRDAAKKYPFVKGISEKWFRIWVNSFWPILGAEIVGPNKLNGQHSKGWVVICPFSPEIMVENPDRARKMIIRTARLCEKLGVKLVALGGYNSIITHDGGDLLGKTSLRVTTGNTYSALLIMQNLTEVSKALEFSLLDLKVGLIGAAGSVGMACARLLPQLVKELWLMDLNGKELKKLMDDLQQKSKNVFKFDNVSQIKNLDVVITVTSTPKAIIHSEHVQEGMILIDAAQPYNVSEEMPKVRKDVLAISSGIGKVPYLDCKIELGPHDQEVFACMGEAIALTCEGLFEDYSIGKVDPQKVIALESIVTKLGFRVADFRNSNGYVTQAQLKDFKLNYFNKKRT